MQATEGLLPLLVLVEQHLESEEANADGGGGDDGVVGDDVQDAGVVVLGVIVHLRRHLGVTVAGSNCANCCACGSFAMPLNWPMN